MAKFQDGLFTNDDFLQIENVLYTPREEELIARRVFSLNTSYAPYAEEIGYDFYEKEGSAKILAKGASAKDIPFVGEKGGRVTQKVYDIATGIRWTKAERDAIAAKRALGKGPSIALDTLRVETARRMIFETENTTAFVGNSTYGIKGIFDASFYGAGLGTSQNVALGAGASRLWSLKTAKEILADLRTGVETVEQDGLFKSRVLLLSPSRFNALRQPYSDESPMTLMQWLQSNGMYFDSIIATRQMSSTINGDSVDYFMIIDNDPEVVQLALVEDIMLLDPVYDIVGTMEQAVNLRTGGIIVRHPAGLYIGKGI